MCTTTVDVLDTREIAGVEHRVYLEQDPDAESPRDMSDIHAGVIVAPSRKYSWPMEDGESVTASAVAYAIEDHSFRVVARWLRMFHGATVVLPLYTTGSEGRPATGDETDQPEAGDYIGVTFDQGGTREATGIPADGMAVALGVDVDEYSRWAIGEVYGYVVERRETEESDPAMLDGAGWEQVDSLWGLIGADYARQEAERVLSDL